MGVPTLPFVTQVGGSQTGLAMVVPLRYLLGMTVLVGELDSKARELSVNMLVSLFEAEFEDGETESERRRI
jgi:hypothetical protein